MKLLVSLPRKNTDALIGGVAKVLAEEGVELLDSTVFLQPLLAPPGCISQREMTEPERADVEYGRQVARALAGFDIGQSVVICERACVAVEAMEGTDATIQRAGEIMRQLEGAASVLERRLTVVKVAKPGQDMRFDVPIVGLKTIETMRAAGATCLALDAGKCLLLDGEKIIRAADEAGIAIVAE